ncbi:MAG: CopY family transcriptional regulator, partial [Cyanobacteria bacterium J06641_2]
AFADSLDEADSEKIQAIARRIQAARKAREEE